MSRSWLLFFLSFLSLHACSGSASKSRDVEGESSGSTALEHALRRRLLPGEWKSKRGDVLSIGCAGTFSADLVNTSLVLPASQDSRSRVSAVNEFHFVVNRFPLENEIYQVHRWPYRSEEGLVMEVAGVRWRRVKAFDCD